MPPHMNPKTPPGVSKMRLHKSVLLLFVILFQGTWADLYVAEFVKRLLDTLGKSIVDEHPVVQAHLDKVHSLPGIEKHLKKRPDWPF
ncbi:MAG: hypothetical protein GY696_16975 [Gammaproteobacteria bacterium]|nr:hypothetical protein [Gammaproteobacteria bacterium]